MAIIRKNRENVKQQAVPFAWDDDEEVPPCHATVDHATNDQ